MAEAYHNKNNVLTVDGAKLTHARVRANYSLQDVADACECNKSQVSRWETGDLNPSQERILKMVELFGRHDFVVVNATEWYWQEKFGKAEGAEDGR
jgi:transcriptional regulator with XRE-family HTH domain